MPTSSLQAIIAEFQKSYDSEEKDRIWKNHSEQFRKFWNERILAVSAKPIADEECDKIICILDRNGKGNTKSTEAVAKAMVPQGAWRRMMNEFHTNKPLARLVTRVLEEPEVEKKARLIDELYETNEGQKNRLTGPSGNALNAYLAAYDPTQNLSVISLKDRRALIDFLALTIPFDWDTASIGTRISYSNRILLQALRDLDVGESARTVSVFCYFPPMKALWKEGHTVRRTDKAVNVTVPTATDNEEEELHGEAPVSGDELRESMKIQALLAYIGAAMGYSIWLPRADRGRVLTVWNAKAGELLDDLPLGYNAATMKTVEQIDVLWMRKRMIVRAFEVEHTTSVYSGLLRMADLVALQPNIDINLHIVAPEAKREKVLQELRRPVFALLEGKPLPDICTYISYDSVRALSEDRHLQHLRDKVLKEYEERAEEDEEED